MIKLQTKRTIIRDHKLDDLLTHHELYSNIEAMHYLQGIATNTLAESESNLKQSISQSKETDRKMYFFRIEDKFLNTHIGEIGYTVNEVTPLGKIIEVGYFIKPKFWGKGYTSEALEEVIRFAFEENNVFRISCGCLKENIASEKVMIKCGMIKEAEFISLVWHNGQIKDRVVYRLLRNEWSN